MSNKDTEIKSSYEDYSVEELQKALKDVFFATGDFSDADIEKMDQIVAVLKEKHPVPRKYTTEESWELFQETYSEEFARLGIRNTEEVMEKEPETVVETGSVRVAAATSDAETVKAKPFVPVDEKPHRKCSKKLKHTALVAAAVVAIMVLVTVSAGAIGINIWGWVPVWNDSTFKFVPEDSVPVTSLDIPEALKQLGVEEPLFPTWIPEGFLLAEQQIHMEKPVIILALYVCENRAITISIRPLSSESKVATIEKDDYESIVYTKNSIDHYIFSNNLQSTCSWISDSYQIKISGDISFDEIIAMIDSVYCEVE